MPEGWIVLNLIRNILKLVESFTPKSYTDCYCPSTKCQEAVLPTGRNIIPTVSIIHQRAKPLPTKRALRRKRDRPHCAMVAQECFYTFPCLSFPDVRSRQVLICRSSEHHSPIWREHCRDHLRPPC